MKWREFLDQELECEECPIYQEGICSGGVKCYGGMPIEPPCCSFDDDTDLDEWVGRAVSDTYFEEQREIEKEKEEARKQAIAKKACGD